jgi:hypothetical protein
MSKKKLKKIKKVFFFVATPDKCNTVPRHSRGDVQVCVRVRVRVRVRVYIHNETLWRHAHAGAEDKPIATPPPLAG